MNKELDFIEWARNSGHGKTQVPMNLLEMILDYQKHVEAQFENLNIHRVAISLPTNDEACAEGYRIANDAGYNYRRVLRDQSHDIYYSGWMDCFDWISKVNER